jgi:hypothetical protein
MKMWMNVMRDMEYLLADYDRILDAWGEGGVTGLVIGPPEFNTPKVDFDKEYVPCDEPVAESFDPNPEVYRRFGLEPPLAPEDKMPERRALLTETLQAASDRGFEVYLWQSQVGWGPGGDGHYLFDEKTMASYSARIIDRLEQFPMAKGTVFDSPEWGYEIHPHYNDHITSVFYEMPEVMRAGVTVLGYDFDALNAAKDRFFEKLHNLDRRQIGLHASGGFLGGLHLFGADPDLTAWLRFRMESLTAHYRRVREGVDAETTRSIKVGIGSRTAAFAPLCGFDLAGLAEFADFLCPKFYVFHRGFDGLVGTVNRYVETLCDWNPKLTDQDALEVVRALFGLELPNVHHRGDLDYALTPEFYETVIWQETRRALAVVDDPGKIVPWVDAGRAPHAGDPLSPGDLGRLIGAAGDAGLQRFLYHHQGNLTPGEWSVMSDICGNRWQRETSEYCPPDDFIL